MSRLYVDEDVSLTAATLLRQYGHDVLTTRDAQRRGSSDASQLLFANDSARLLIAHNRRDYQMLHDAWQRWPLDPLHRHHAGILIVPQTWTPERTADEIDALLAAASSVANQMISFSLQRDRWERFSFAEWGYVPLAEGSSSDD